MNPMLFEDIDLSFFNFFFGSKDDKKASKKEKKSEPKKEKKEEKKIVKKHKEEANNNINKPEDKNKKSIKEDDTKEKIINKEEKSEKKDKKEEIKEDKKEENITENMNKIVIEEDKKIKKKNSIKKLGVNKKKKKGERTKEELLSFLVNYIKNVYLFKKNVKKVIQRHKENYAIISSLNNADFYMEIYLSEDKTKKIKYTYEPIFKENIFYIPRTILKKKNLLKFSFINKKKECFIDPKFNTEYDSGEFINVINLKKIKDKEEEREEDFQTFLESYYTLKSNYSKDIHDSSNKYKLEFVRVKKKHRTMDSQKGGLNFGVNKFPSNSILKQRSSNRKISTKKITFSDKNETIAYKKEE